MMFVRRCMTLCLRHRRYIVASSVIVILLTVPFYFHRQSHATAEKEYSLPTGEATYELQETNVPQQVPKITFVTSSKEKVDFAAETDAGQEQASQLNNNRHKSAEGTVMAALPDSPASHDGIQLIRRQPSAGLYQQSSVGGAPLKSYGSQRIVYPSQNHFYSAGDVYRPSNNSENQTSLLPPFIPERRVVHLDLKGAPPKVEFLEKLFPIIAKLGATSLLIEYEDMFPYEGVLKSITARNHYSKEDIRTILALADTHKLEVIPLVQTFGHVEFILKLEQFMQLRENPAVPQALCPSRNESMNLVELVIDQVMAMHPEIKYLHIGCDEVFHIGECDLCNQKTKEELFLKHVTRVARYARDKYQVTPLIWDDMLRNMVPDIMKQYRLGELVEPVVWVYAEDVYRFANSRIFDRYAGVFPTFWGSSAFKGAFGETYVAPNVKRHLENNQNWLTAGRDEGTKFREGFRGLILAGWQRYDHFAVLCELLPSAVPSLALNLLTVSRGYFNNSLAGALYDSLQCSRSPKYERVPDLEYDPYMHEKMSGCFFPGAPFFKAITRFLRVEKMIENYVSEIKIHKGWLTDYSVRRNFSSPARVDELVRDLAYMTSAASTLARQIMDSLADIFDAYTVSEWLEQKLLPLLQKLDKISVEAQQLRLPKTWPQRPLKVFDQWAHYGIDLQDYFAKDKNN